MLDRIFAPDNIEQAMTHLLSKKNAISTDGVQLSDLKSYWDINGNNLIERIKSGLYQPYDVIGSYLLQKNGKHRFITVFATTDRLILRLIYQVLNPLLDPMFADNVFGFRKERGIVDAINKALEHVNNGFRFVVKFDIADFFEEMSHDILLEQLSDLIDDKVLVDLIGKYLTLNVKIIDENRSFTLKKGVAQGSSISPLLSNIYLNRFDAYCQDNGWRTIRYADDITVFVDERDELINVFDAVQDFLAKRLLLSINAQKTVMSDIESVTLLGYTFNKAEDGYRATKKMRKKNTVYYDWHRIEYHKLYGDYHIISDGILRKKDFTLFFENENNYQHMPVNAINAINVYSNVYFTSEFFRTVSQHKIPLHIYDKNRTYLGTFNNPDVKSGAKMLLAQCAVYYDESLRMSYARAIVEATAKTIKANLNYYRQSIDDKLYYHLHNKITQIIDTLSTVESITVLMTKEANIRFAYFSAFDHIIKNNQFVFDKRTIRPPRNEVNSMISFGNTLLYNYFSTAISKHNLDIRISYLHSAKKPRYNLNLDLAEMFKPAIIDRLNFRLINKHMIDVNLHFETNGGGVFLNDEGKRLYLQQFTQMMIKQHKVSGDVITNFTTLIDREIATFKKAVSAANAYKPFCITRLS